MSELATTTSTFYNSALKCISTLSKFKKTIQNWVWKSEGKVTSENVTPKRTVVLKYILIYKINRILS
jgi:hypothetical protein